MDLQKGLYDKEIYKVDSATTHTILSIKDNSQV